MQEETIEECPLCNTERVSGDDYCKCGYEFSSTEPEPQPEPTDSVLQTDEQWLKDNKESIGKLIFPDKTKELVDDSQRLVGRADLKKHTKDPISSEKHIREINLFLQPIVLVYFLHSIL